MNIEQTTVGLILGPTPAEQILRQAKELADQANALSDCLAIRLTSVCLPLPPEVPHDGKVSRVEENFPPLFHELRRQLRCIEDKLTCIDGVLSRLGL